MRKVLTSVSIGSMLLASLAVTPAFAVHNGIPECNGLHADIWVNTGNNHIMNDSTDTGVLYAGVLNGTNFSDVFVGTAGNDTINGGNGGDTICGGDGNDTINGENGTDTIFGENGNDVIRGGNGGDAIDGGPDYDFCNGDSGPSITTCEATTGQGVVIITKDAVPNDAQDFGFTGGLGAFTLDDDSNGTLPNSQTFNNQPVGSIAVTESVVAGWSLTGIVCTDGGSTTNVPTRTATIDLDEAEVITCTFTNTQVVAVCGNGSIEVPEGCDDGNTTSGDGCTATCIDEFCGDGVDNDAANEACDDGNAVNTDGCSNTCTLPVCGDNIVQAGSGEQCDDGNATNGDGCSATCQTTTQCNDTVDNGDAEDVLVDSADPGCHSDGNALNGGSYVPADNDETNTSPFCSNGVVEAGEQCDDGNLANSDGCSSICQNEVAPVCGNNDVEGVEACDDGDTDPNDGCSATCTIESGYGCTGDPSVCSPICGNGIVTGSETCDDGNTTPSDGCSATCTEESGYDCTGQPSSCAPICGDNIIAGAETCDDGNTASNDGCSATCQTEVSSNACPAVTMLGYWPFEEGSGTTTVDLTLGNDGTLEAGTLWAGAGAPNAGGTDSLTFDGIDDQVRAANSSDFSLANAEFTVSLFAKSTAGDRSVLGNYDGDGWGLYFYSSERINFFGYGTMGINDTSHAAPDLLDGNWHHIAGVYTRSGNDLTITVYYDGVAIGSNTVAVGDITSGSDLLFGRYLLQPHYQGMLDDIRVYNAALTAQEVADLAGGCNSVDLCSPSDTDLSAYWRGDEGTGTNAEDSTTFDNFGTLQNGATWTSATAPTVFDSPNAFSFDGTDDSVLVSDTTGLPAGSTARTVALWMNQDSIANQASLVSLGNGNIPDQKFIVQMADVGGTTYLFTDGINGPNNITVSGLEIPSTGAWHHLAFTFDGVSAWEYFLDGTPVKSGTFAIPINTVTNAVELGSRHDVVTGYYDGSLDDVRVYSRVLSDAEIGDLAAGMCETASTPAVCGNGDVESGEACDDGNTMATDGCSATCTIESGYACSGEPSSCAPICGDSVTIAPETCDDGNVAGGDGCSATCTVEAPVDTDGDGQTDADETACGSNPNDANSVSLDTDGDNIPDCVDPDDDNDGILDGPDNCDLVVNPGQEDLDTDGIGDACDPQTCGNGDVEGTETCDDGDQDSADGCSNVCAVEPGWACVHEPSVCVLAPLCNGQSATIFVDSTPGSPTVFGGLQSGLVYSGFLFGTNANDVMVGTNGNDIISASNGSDLVCAGGGDDRVDGSNGNDTLYGEGGADRLDGSNENDILDGGLGNDRLDGSNGNDQLFGRDGSDILTGSNDADLACGGMGNDSLKGDSANDRMDGGAGTDNMQGGLGTDICVNGEGFLSSCENTVTPVPECA